MVSKEIYKKKVLLYNNIELLLNNLLCNDNSNQYCNLVYKVQQTTRDIVKSIIVSTFE